MGRKKGGNNCHSGAADQNIVRNTCNYWEVPARQSMLEQLMVICKIIFNTEAARLAEAEYRKTTISYKRNAEAMRRLRASRKTTRKPRAWL